MKDKSPKKDDKKIKIALGILLFISIFVFFLNLSDSKGTTGTITYNEFISDLENGYIDYIEKEPGAIMLTAYYKEGMAQENIIDKLTGEEKKLTIVDNQRKELLLNPNDEDLIKTIAMHDVEIKLLGQGKNIFITMIVSLLPTVLLIGLMVWLVKMQMGGGMKEENKEVKKSTTRFTDVAGLTEEKEELMFAIRSLQHKDEYVAKGVKPVRGILLEGPPGVGKTLLAKAVAGEAGVNFLSYSGSDFVEMFVGLGARRVRSMYEKAEKMKPCVVFIDEIDALGKKREAGGNAGNQEADQTLVALLEKMDGMNTTSGILFIAATNRVDALDKALLRPGRFDKTIHVSPPRTREDREAIVALHVTGKTLAEGVTVEKIAKQCYGLTGAEIAAAMNDAVLESFKADRDGSIMLDDVDKAIMKLFARGLAKGKHSEKDLERVAIHEAGHAVMDKHVGRSVVKVSIQPYSSGVGGVTQVDGETGGFEGLMTKTDLINSVKVMYAGKVAEETLLGECSVGASNDLERATFAIRDYVGTYGMKDKTPLSLVGLAQENMMITANEQLLKNMEEIANSIYAEVVEYFSQEDVKKTIQYIADVLIRDEVIYDFETEYKKATGEIPLTKETTESSVEEIEQVGDENA